MQLTYNRRSTKYCIDIQSTLDQYLYRHTIEAQNSSSSTYDQSTHANIVSDYDNIIGTYNICLKVDITGTSETAFVIHQQLNEFNFCLESFQIVVSLKYHRHNKPQFNFHLDISNSIVEKKLEQKQHFRNMKLYVVQEYNLNPQNFDNDKDLVWWYYHRIDIS